MGKHARGNACPYLLVDTIMRITTAEYFGTWVDHPDITETVKTNAGVLLIAVNGLIVDLMRGLVYPRTNPKTGSAVSGETGGGFRPQDYPVGAPKSAHKTGEAIDLFDPYAAISGYLFVRQELLRKHGLWMEAPAMTVGWCHLQTRPVKSGNTVFYP